jgi:hypothetical protein
MFFISRTSAIAVLAGFVLTGVLVSGVKAEYENSDIPDPASSIRRSGITTPREYYIPPTPPFEKIDPREFEDYGRLAYSPYTQLQIPRPIMVGRIRLKEGYYLVKLDIGPVPKKTWAQKLGLKKPPELPEVDPKATEPESSNEHMALQMIIKQMGSVELSIPIYASERLPVEKRSRWERVKSWRTPKPSPRATLVVTAESPLRPEVVSLRYCLESTCYRTAPLEPGWVQ